MKCERCGKEHNGEYGSGRFCSRSCANTRIHSTETKQKISERLISLYPNHYCICCGKQLERIPENKSKKYHKYCDDCQTIYRIIPTLQKYFGLDISTLGTVYIFDEINKIKEILYTLYWNKNISSTNICKMYNYPNVGNLTGKIFKYLNIPTKSCKQTNQYTVYTRNIQQYSIYNIYKSGWHTTWDGKEVYLRSSYELDYAKELDDKQIRYDVECLRIKYFNTILNEYHCAIPDFYLPDTNEIIEIKSTWTLKGKVQEMKDKFKEYINLGYKTKLILEHQEISIDNLSED